MRLPVNDTTNGWANTLPPRAPNPPLAGDRTADVIVIGAGYAGLAAARRFAENRPEAEVVLIDAAQVGQGASARNSGFVIDLPHNVGADLHDAGAQRRALRLARAATAELERLVSTHQIDCQWSRQGQIMAAKSGPGGGVIDGFMAGLDSLGETYTALDAEAVAARIGSRYYSRGVHTPGTVLMQPAALVRGLAASLPENVSVYEDTPVTTLHRGATIRAETPHGTLSAPQAIVCVNGFAPELGLLKGRIFAVQAFCSMTRPLTEEEHASLGSPENWGLVPAMAFGGPTMRYTMDRRLTMRSLWRVRQSMRTRPGDYTAARVLQAQQLRDRFPGLPGGIIEHTWAGNLALSRNFAPGFTQPAANLWTAVCQNGVGVTKGTIAGLLAADRACGRDNDLLADMLALGEPVQLPPRPFLDLGAIGTLKLWEFQQRHER